MNPQALERWSDPEARGQVVEAAGFEHRKAQFRQVQDFVKTMHDACVRIALGTDSGSPPNGWSATGCCRRSSPVHHTGIAGGESGAGRSGGALLG